MQIQGSLIEKYIGSAAKYWLDVIWINLSDSNNLLLE